MKSCFFIGHRDAPESVLSSLTIAVERLIVEENVGHFYVGQYGSFDRMAALAVKQLKEKHPTITLYLVLPYHPAERPIEIPPGFDNTYYPPGMEKVPRKLAIVRANRYMVDHVDYLIAYAWHPASNARDLVEYAKKREQRNLISVTVLPRS